jgi:hypothetical protein
MMGQRLHFATMMLAVLLPSVPLQAKEPPYAIVQRFDIPGSSSRTNIQLLIDSRLTATVRRQMWESSELDKTLGHSQVRDLSSVPPKNAKIELHDGQGKLVAERELAGPLAKLSPWNPGSRDPTFFLTIDYSIGFGSYNGPSTTLLQISTTGFNEVQATNVSTHEIETIRLQKTLKADWKIVRGKDRTEILSIICYPDLKTQNDFLVEFKRFVFEGKKWESHQRQERGLWESDEIFPARSAFP